MPPLVIVTTPVDTEPIPIVPAPLALIVRFSSVPLDITATANPPAAAADLTLRPVAEVAVDASTLNAGLDVPAKPTARAFADADVIVCAALVIVLEIATVPVTANPLDPIVAPLMASDVAVATPKAGVVRDGDVARTYAPVPCGAVPPLVIVTTPVETVPIPIVPVLSASIVRFVAPLVSVTATATVPFSAAPVTFRPAVCVPADASTLNAGPVVPPCRPTANAEEPADVNLSPAAANVANVVPPLVPPVNAIVSVVPVPEVVWSVRIVPVVPDPPIISGTVNDVVTVCAGKVVDHDGAPDPFVTRTLLFAVVISPTTLAPLEYSN